MKRINDKTIQISQNEADLLRSFIWDSLYFRWDRYTDNVICEDSLHDGMKKMNPAAYSIMDQFDCI